MVKFSWQQEHTILTYEAGPDGRAPLSTICNLLQECAIEHAEHLGVGYESMRDRGLAWAVARMVIETARRPGAGEGVTVQTWLNGTRGPFAMREFAVVDSSSAMIARATYAWLAIDIETRKPVRPNRLVGDFKKPENRKCLDAHLGKIPDPVDPKSLDSLSARPSDIDIQKHVNNSRYITWIEDAAAVDTAAVDSPSLQAKRLHVNFLAEAFAGDRINISIGGAPDGGESETGAASIQKIVLLSRAEDGVELTRALITLMPDVESADTTHPGKNQTGKEETLNEELTAALAAASKIAGLDLTPAERSMALKTVTGFQEEYDKRRTVRLENGLGPAVVFAPHLHNPAQLTAKQTAEVHATSANDKIPDIPADETEIAFASLRHLGEWLKRGAVSSTRLCEIYIDRIKRYDPALSCVVTLTEELAFKQAERADDELRHGIFRGPLHGIPWGAKDLLDTKGILTTWGAMPFKERVPDSDAVVVQMLEEAGCVLLGKLTLGALAYGDIWFGGKTKNPWNTEQGSSGSSAGPASAVVAGLAGFCIGSETMGSIVSPSLRCGAAGLRPSFGRVPRTGAMALSWSYDKIGPICRHAEDTVPVLEAITGLDRGDPGSLDLPFSFEAGGSAAGMKIGYNPKWFAAGEDGVEYTDLLKRASESLAEHGAGLVEVQLPELPYETLSNLVTIDAAAAFEELTLSNRDDELVWQEPEAWPNSFRAARFFPAVEYVQLQRFRRLVAQEMNHLFSKVDAMISPERRSSLLVITNSTGQPSLTIRAGFRDNGTPFGLNIWGRYAGESAICHIGIILERAFDAADSRPPGFE